MVKTTNLGKNRPLKILTYPDKGLRGKAAKVDIEKQLIEIQHLVDLMFKTIKFYQGIGLAAPQVGVHYQVAIVDIDDGNPLTLINPEIIKIEEEVESYEGCLSFPHIQAYVPSFNKIDVRFWDYDGVEKTIGVDGLLARCIYHEINHLNGILFIDGMSNMKRDMIIKTMKKRKGLV